MKNTLLILFFVLFKTGLSQNSTKTEQKLINKEAQQVFQQLDGSIKENALSIAAKDACTCIDSIRSLDWKPEELTAKIKKCIDKVVGPYQMSVKLFDNFKDTSGNKIISINTNTESTDYLKYYYTIERRLMDSCISLKKVINSRDKSSKNSYSESEQALDQYTFGTQLSDKGMYEDAITFYVNAVKIDPMFSFAWDNLGICYRKTNQVDKAIEAYKKSISINPYGEMPLQNIAVAYESKKEYDKAIDAYKEYLQSYPDGVEGYYGIGRLLFFYKHEDEQALENICKAYNLYVKMSSPYRVDAEKLISQIYADMKQHKKEKEFNEVSKNTAFLPNNYHIQ